MNKVLVVQYEQFFDLKEDSDLPEAIRDSLETLRMYGGGRVVGSYETEETKEWLGKAVDTITVHSPMTVRID